MTTEHTAPETAQSRVEITTNEKGEARVSVKVYVPASWPQILTMSGLDNQMADIANVAARTLHGLQARVRANGQRVAGDPPVVTDGAKAEAMAQRMAAKAKQPS